MRLELEPIEGEHILSSEEQEWQEKRNHPIPPEILLQFKSHERDKIKKFLVRLIVLTEQFHHDMKQLDISTEEQRVYYKQEIQKINKDRQALFQHPPRYLESFIKLLELCPMEPWHEFEALLKSLQDQEMQHYRDTKLKTGIAAALDNPFLLRTEDEIDEQHVELQMNCRKTPHEIEELITHNSLENLVKLLIDARRINTGAIWDRGFYDL
jgi:hypothetical protein